MMYLTCHVCVFLFFCFLVFLVLWPEKWHKQWQAWQGKLWTKQVSVWLTNQQICLMIQFIHLAPQHVVQRTSWANYLDPPLKIKYLYIQNPVHYHANWTEEKRHAKNTMPLSFHFSSRIGFVLKYTESTVYTLKNSSYQNITKLIGYSN